MWSNKDKGRYVQVKYLSKQDALRLEIYRHSLALAVQVVLKSDELDATHLTLVFPRHGYHQLTRLITSYNYSLTSTYQYP